MAPEVADLLTNALALPVWERARIAHELLLSLDDGAGADTAEAWVAELQQRAVEVRTGSGPADWRTRRRGSRVTAGSGPCASTRWTRSSRN